MNNSSTKSKSNILNKETMATLREYSGMKKDKKKYKRHNSFNEMIKGL